MVLHRLLISQYLRLGPFYAVTKGTILSKSSFSSKSSYPYFLVLFVAKSTIFSSSAPASLCVYAVLFSDNQWYPFYDSAFSALFPL